MKLSELLRGVPVISQNTAEIEINGISCDSRSTAPGDVFVCIAGEHKNGADYIADALTFGAKAVVVPENVILPADLPCVRVKDTRLALSFMWYNYYASPRLPTVCITGTCGKTSVAFMLKHILSEHGLRVGLMGSICSMIGDEKLKDTAQSELWEMPCAMTTPDPKYLYGTLRQMCDAGCDMAVMEASSHALAQRKLDPLRPVLSVFTNLSPEHLDYHLTMDEYLKAKAHLFTLSDRGILYGDDEAAKNIASIAPDCKMTYLSPDGDYRISNVNLLGAQGVSYTLTSPASTLDIRVPIPGEFSVQNSALAAAAALELGIDGECVTRALSALPGVEGRMEKIHSGDFTVIRDYAHTASALRAVLETVRKSAGGRVITVFGCGGDRDKSKRAPMGECATELSDLTVITSDNSRNENPVDIIEDILRGVRKNKAYTVIPARREAIIYALDRARRGDVVMLCGKGHENYEIDSRGKHPFDEKKIVEEYFKKS